MAKDRKRKADDEPREDAPGAAPIKGSAYEEQIYKLHVELVKLQEWVQQTGVKICIVFEGRPGMAHRGSGRFARTPARPPSPGRSRAHRPWPPACILHDFAPVFRVPRVRQR